MRHAELSSTTNSDPVMIWSAGPDGLCRSVNSAWTTFRGRTLQQERGDGWLAGIHPEDRTARQDLFACSRHDGTPFHCEFRLLRHDQSYRWMMETAVPRLSRRGEVLEYTGSCVDVQERRQQEQELRDHCSLLRRQNDELSELAYGAAHDLQEPLRTIRAHTQLMARRSVTPPGDECVRFITGAVQYLEILIRDLSTYSWVNNGMELTSVVVDCNAAVAQVLLACDAAVAQSGAVISHEPLPLIYADNCQFVHLLQNLVTNAIKYRRPEAPPRIHVSATTLEDEWLFEVADNGIGFDPEHAESIFGLFKRLHRDPEYGGAGLGLAICKKIVERHNGRIWARTWLTILLHPAKAVSFGMGLLSRCCPERVLSVEVTKHGTEDNSEAARAGG